MAATARTVCAVAPTIPIVADAGIFQNLRTVKDLIAAAAAGCFLEDQAWPKKCGHMCGKQTTRHLSTRLLVIPAEEHATKIASARDAIGDSYFFLVTRTDARATSAKTGLSVAIARANLYMEAGADACFVEAPRNNDELKDIGRQTRVSEFVISLYASTCALVNVLKTLKENGITRNHLNKMAAFEEFNQLVNLESWFELEAKYSNFKKIVEAKS
ncbi:carboxyvinyl-carboxyphosphonate phosphorylmutase, chloroplastic-like [Melia azedarach]|uniref:Carboxyvinyl-carboxyphosphonate phosphorylmutase, chloroplastic-like n=1 Tax=Melia azedarach TaxID=155640 RepID=A0ACC1WP76_MELAZ|nr:carboxyvinyl-carboxyphosphonate phosphorylmutase, chloroplastic-like [Melia azedarach]